MRSIGDVTTPVSTWSPSRSASPTTFEYIDLGTVDNERKVITSPAKISTSEAPSRARQLVAAGDVLVSTVRPNLNAVAIVPPSLHGATASTGFTVLRPSDELHGRYLFHWVRSSAFIEDMVRKATGASYPAVSDRIIKKAEIPLPPLDEQGRIAAILDQADALRAKRRQTLDLLTRMRGVLFDATFGAGDAAWPRVNFGELIHSSQLGLVRSAAEQGSDRPHEYVKMDAITEAGDLSLTSVARVAASLDELRRFTFSDGDLLFNTRNSRELVGKSAVYRGPPRLFNNNLMRLRFVDTVLPDYAHGYLWSNAGRRQLEARKSGTTSVFAVYAKDLATVRMPVPPLHLQSQFAMALAAVRLQRSHAAEHERALHDLLRSLGARLLSRPPIASDSDRDEVRG